MEKQQQKEEKREEKANRKISKENQRETDRQRREQEKEEKVLKKELSKSVSADEEVIEDTKKVTDKKQKKKEKEPIPDLLPVTWASSYLPVKQIRNGVIYTSDGRYVKLVEVLPINLLLRSPAEQRNIIFSFMSYLKIAPDKIQFKVLSKKADIKEYIEKIREEARNEPDERYRLLQEDYAELIRTLGTREAITRRFFLIFEYQSYSGNKNPNEREVYLYLKSAVQTAKNILPCVEMYCWSMRMSRDSAWRYFIRSLTGRPVSMKHWMTVSRG